MTGLCWFGPVILGFRENTRATANNRSGPDCQALTIAFSALNKHQQGGFGWYTRRLGKCGQCGNDVIILLYLETCLFTPAPLILWSVSFTAGAWLFWQGRQNVTAGCLDFATSNFAAPDLLQTVKWDFYISQSLVKIRLGTTTAWPLNEYWLNGYWWLEHCFSQ